MLTLQELRARLHHLHAPATRERFPFSRFADGFPRGALVEISGRGKCEAVAAFLAENPYPTAWIEERREIFPPALLQRNVDLQKILFIEGGKESAWAAATVLRSKAFPILIYAAKYRHERELRRWQLLAEKANSSVLLLRDSPSQFWPISLALRMEGRTMAVARKK